VRSQHQALGGLLQQSLEGDAVDHVERIDGVALRLGHLVAFGVAHDGIDVHVAERSLAGELQGRHDHARDPEEDDVVAGDEHRRREIEAPLAFELRLVGPAERGEGHQRRREPGIEHIRIARGVGDRLPGRFGVRLRLGEVAPHERRSIGGVPRRNLVAPPELARDAPVLDVHEPLVVDLGPLVGHETRVALRHRREARLGHAVHAHEPLVGEHRLDHGVGALRAGLHELVGLGAFHEPRGFKIGEDLLAGNEAVEPAIGRRRVLVHLRVEREDVHQRQAVPHAHLVVVEVVGRGDLDHAGAELAIDVCVGDDRDQAIGERQAHLPAHELRVALVLGMHRDGGVTEHRLGARRGDNHMAAAILEGVLEVPEVAVLLARFDLEVRDRGLQHRIPVDEPLAAIDEARLEEAHEDLGHGVRARRVHGEVLARPVARGAQAAHLARDRGARFFLPGPDALHELLAPERAARLAFRLQLALDHHLRGDARVIGARLPQDVEPLHPVVAGEHVHERLLVGVAHVQRAGHVGRRQLDRERRARRVEAGLEVAARFPEGVPA
jgi:hypothetical protein